MGSTISLGGTLVLSRKAVVAWKSKSFSLAATVYYTVSTFCKIILRQRSHLLVKVTLYTVEDLPRLITFDVL